MPIKLNKIFSLIVLLLIVIIKLIGVPLIWIFQNSISINVLFDSTLKTMLFGSVILQFSYLCPLIIGVWFFLKSDKLTLDKWTWLIIGLIYGEYALLLMAIIIIIQSIRTKINLIQSLIPILILLVLSRIISPLLQMLSETIIVKYHSLETQLQLNEWTRYINLFFVIIIYVVNIILAFRLNSWIKSLNIPKRGIWGECS